jgi:GT2 family glycosyltransferase
MKTQALLQALEKHGFDAALGGARRDEEKSRAKERVFSFRSAAHRWDPRHQRPELWHLYNTSSDIAPPATATPPRKLPAEIVVVFNEPDTLERVFLQSAGLDDATLVLIDNGARGVGLPTLFNRHKQRSTAEWLVFCHQDFIVFDAEWIRRIVALPPAACYGPIGRDASLRWRGQIAQTDGSLLGEPAPMGEVVGVDEVCLVVPRDIYTRVDFDEGFPFDLYVHDYCLAARRLGYPTRIVQLHCQHRSKTLDGDVTSTHYRLAKQRFIEKHAGTVPLVTSSFHVM